MLFLSQSSIHKMKRIHSKNFFLTTGFWASIGQVALAIAPSLTEFDKTGHFTGNALITMVSSAALAIAGVLDRLDGNNTVVYTPDGVPGLNRDEAKSLARTQTEATAAQTRYFPKASDEDSEFWNPEED